MTQSYSKSIVYFKNAGIVWTVLGLAAGLINELQLMTFVPGSESPVGYGLLKPIANDMLIFGGLLSLFLGYALRILDREGAKSKVGVLSIAAFLLVQVGVGLGIGFLAGGFSSGREYGEFNFHSHNMILLAMAIVLGLSIYNLGGQQLSAAGQFQIVTLAGMIVTYFLGNFGFPNSILTSVAPTAGMQDAAVQEFYRMAVLTYFVYLPLLTILYQAVPEKFGVKIANTSAVRFQLVASMALVPLAAGSGLLYSVAPQLLQILGAFAASALAISVLAGTVNLHDSFKGAASPAGDSVVLAIRFGGLLLTVLTALQAITRLPFARHYLQYTAWGDADPFFTAATAGLLVFAVALSMLATNGKQGLQQWAVLAIVAGAALAIVASLGLGLLEGITSLALTDAGTLKNASWSAVSAASSLSSGSPAMQYLLSLNGLILVAKAMLLVGFSSSVSFFFEGEHGAA